MSRDNDAIVVGRFSRVGGFPLFVVESATGERLTAHLAGSVALKLRRFKVGQTVKIEEVVPGRARIISLSGPGLSAKSGGPVE